MCEFVVMVMIASMMLRLHAGNFIIVHLRPMGVTRLQREREEAARLQVEISTVVTEGLRVKSEMLNCW